MSKIKRVSSGLPWYGCIFVDIFGLFLSLGPGAIAWASGFLYLKMIFSLSAITFFFCALLFPIVLVVAFICPVFLMRILLPRLKRGVYPMGVNRGSITWFCHLGLSRSAEISGLRPLLNAFYLTKFLHWRALGMQIDYGVNTSIGVSFVDLAMIKIGKGSTISEGVHIACHTFVGDRLWISPVEIGENVFVGMNCILGPKAKIGNGAWIGMNNLISDPVAPSAKIDNFEWEHGKPKA
jgi:hypothetical protein